MREGEVKEKERKRKRERERERVRGVLDKFQKEGEIDKEKN